MAGQATYTNRPAIAFEGQFYGRPEDVVSRVADSAVQFGRAVSAKDTAQCEVIPAPPASSATSILASGGASATTLVTKVAADFNGAIGAADFLDYSQNVFLTLNAHADWNDTIAILWGDNAQGDMICASANIIVDAGGVVDFNVAMRKVHKLTIQGQTGANGTFTIGTGVKYGPILNLLGVSMHSPAKVGTGVGYAALEMVAIAKAGQIAVTTWDAVVDGDPAWVRHTAADSGFAVGTFGGVQDGTFAAPELSPLIIGGRQARWASVAAAGGLAWLDLG